MFDGGLWSEIQMPPVPRDPLKFKDDKRYTDRLKSAKAKTGRDDCMVAGLGEINGRKSVVLVQDFAFMGGSLGMAAGEASHQGGRDGCRTQGGVDRRHRFRRRTHAGVLVCADADAAHRAGDPGRETSQASPHRRAG